MFSQGMIVLSVVGCLVILVTVFELVRRRRLNIEFSVLWILAALLIAMLSFFPSTLLFLTKLIGARDPGSILLFIGIAFVGLIVLNFSVKISSLCNQIKILTQKIALIENKLQEKEKEEDHR